MGSYPHGFSGTEGKGTGLSGSHSVRASKLAFVMDMMGEGSKAKTEGFVLSNFFIS